MGCMRKEKQRCGRVEFDHVSFGYTRPRNALEDITFAAEPDRGPGGRDRGRQEHPVTAPLCHSEHSAAQGEAVLLSPSDSM
jgi:ABC-type multidrug transport system fused ATPase/permease subunit